MNGFPGRATVLMSVYHGDAPGLLEKALGSVFDNTLAADEVILVADGPLPSGLDVAIEKFTSRHSNFKVLRLERNGGLAAALNLGMRHVRTEWVLRADADDWNDPDRFLRQAEFLAAHPDVSMLGTSIVEVDAVGNRTGVRECPATHAEICRMMRSRNPFNHMTMAVKASAIRAAGGYPPWKKAQDYGLWSSLVMRGHRAANLLQPLVVVSAGLDMYRRRGGWTIVKAELTLQRHLWKIGVKSLPLAVLHALMKCAAAALPAGLLGVVYARFLRKPVA
jgi:glycosyltransferase involved in cell wall biosynthesis